ncbi:C2 calcium-dependent membrane targeting [Corchorus capsularis]|uniref:C2 calcium-dependent membrane targeting n=1 Tax=Corchorus capsularis TaxID=210143 RepID=A0A1R3H1Z0_COCAP|nr:C2 calcium-dependent membrane targeting [Corchorus capsularis]
MEMEMFYVLEITLISAQGLKEPSSKLRRMQTYATAWVDSSVKLRTCIDRVGGENPTWNDKFLFKVSPEFLSSETSGVSVEIFSVGVLKDTLLGTVRFLVSNFLPTGSSFDALKTPSFNAVQVRRPSGRIQGVLNVGATIRDGADVPALSGGVSAIGFRDLIIENIRASNRSMKKSKSRDVLVSRENSFHGSDDQSDGCDSTVSSSSTAARALKEWNEVVGDLEGKNRVRSSSDGGMMFCGLMSSPSRKATCLPTLKSSQSFNEGKLGNKPSRFA